MMRYQLQFKQELSKKLTELTKTIILNIVVKSFGSLYPAILIYLQKL